MIRVRGMEETPRGRSTEVDAYVGARIRARRRMLGVTQEQLAEALGLTHQQIRKYERGLNRVSASKLYKTARILSVPMTYFFEGLDEEDGGSPVGKRDAALQTFLMSEEGAEFAADFALIESGSIRRQMLALVRSLARPEEI
jgi:transcriptional regulator with XRE-family HTH domain